MVGRHPREMPRLMWAMQVNCSVRSSAALGRSQTLQRFRTREPFMMVVHVV
jgi:hypothetical protein